MTDHPRSTAGALLLLAREQAGLSQRELAERACVSQSEIARIESGKHEPGIPTLQRILAGAGVELRLRLEPIDEQDQVFSNRDARRTPAELAQTKLRHERNTALFAANSTKE